MPVYGGRRTGDTRSQAGHGLDERAVTGIHARLAGAKPSGRLTAAHTPCAVTNRALPRTSPVGGGRVRPPFFAAISCITSILRSRSAKSFFSLAFFCSSCRSLFTSSAVMALQCCRYVCIARSLTPCRLAAWGAESSLASRRMPTICSSENRDFLMTLSSSSGAHSQVSIGPERDRQVTPS